MNGPESLQKPLLETSSKDAPTDQAKAAWSLVCKRKESILRCKKVLREIINERGTPEDTAACFDSAFRYKGRYVDKAPLLHVAIFLEASSTEPEFIGIVGRLLKICGISILMGTRGVDSLDWPRTTYRSGPTVAELHGLIIAAGMGDVEVMDALTNHLQEEELAKTLNSQTICLCDGTYFYSPLHDACYLGRTKMVAWLLQHGSDATKRNRDQLRPIHLFTIAGDYDGTVSEVESSLRMLVTKKADIAAKAAYRSRWGDNQYTALDMAIQQDSSFPKALIYLLTPSCSLLDSNSSPTCALELKRRDSKLVIAERTSLIADLWSLASKSPGAAEQLAQEILVSDSDTGRKRRVGLHLLEHVQSPDAVDLVVQILYLSPKVGAAILQNLMGEPFVVDPSHYPIPARTTLWGFFQNVPMRCQYMPDAVRTPEGFQRAAWMYAARTGKATEFIPQWHASFLKDVDAVEDREHTYDVKVVALNVPDFLSAELMLTLSHVCDVDLQIFGTLPIQSVITCMWCGFITVVQNAEVFLMVFEIGPLLSWGLTMGVDGDTFGRLFSEVPSGGKDSSHNSPTDMPICWPILLGVLFSEAILFLSYTSSYIWLVDQRKVAPMVGGKRYNGVCHYWNFPRDVFASSDMALCEPLLLLWLLYSTAGFGGDTLSFKCQALLALNIAARMIKLLRMFRVFDGCGQKIISIGQSFLSGAMRWMMFILLIVFFSFILVFLVLRRQHSVFWNIIYLYRDVIVGDGDGLDRFGLGDEDDAFDAQGDKSQESWSTFYGFTGNIFFNLVIMNLIIAIYSAEYIHQSQLAPLRFMRERARVSARALLRYHTIGTICPPLRDHWVCVALIALWLVSLQVAVAAPEIVTFSICAAFFASVRLSGLVCLSHRRYFPDSASTKLSQARYLKDCVFGRSSQRGKVMVTKAVQVLQRTLEVFVVFDDPSHVYSERLAKTALLEPKENSRLAPWAKHRVALKVKPSLIQKMQDDLFMDDSARPCTYRFVFEPVERVDGYFKLTFEGNEAYDVNFGLSRFIFVCHRDDFDEHLWGPDDTDDSQVDKLQSTSKMMLDRRKVALSNLSSQKTPID